MHHESPVRWCAACRMRYMTGIPHVEVGVRHVDLGPQRPRAVGELPRAHATEQVQAFRHAAVAVRAVAAGRGDGDGTLVRHVGAPVLADLLLAQVADVCLARLDELFRPSVELLEIVGSKELPLPPLEAEPPNVRRDGVDVLLLFLLRVGVVEPEIAFAVKLLRDPEIEADRLCMTDVEVPVGLRAGAARAHVSEASVRRGPGKRPPG